jgi:predicted sugar kinase
MCFESQQGGPYNGPELQERVRLLRRCGVQGVGQSSWGPTIFALCRSQEQAAELTTRLADQDGMESIDCWVTATCNHGARVDPWCAAG